MYDSRARWKFLMHFFFPSQGNLRVPLCYALHVNVSKFEATFKREVPILKNMTSCFEVRRTQLEATTSFHRLQKFFNSANFTRDALLKWNFQKIDKAKGSASFYYSSKNNF